MLFFVTGLAQTGRAELLAAIAAGAEAAGTESVVAAVTTDGAIATKRAAASVAVISAVFVDQVTAFLARYSFPIVQLYIGTASAIGMEQLGDQQKEVVQAAFGQRSLDGCPAIALAELFVLDVRMGDVLALGGRIRIQCHDTIGGR